MEAATSMMATTITTNFEASAEILARAYRRHLEAGNFPDGERSPDFWEYIASINQRVRRRVTIRHSEGPANRENHLTLHLSGGGGGGGTGVGFRSDVSLSSITDLDDHEPGNCHYSSVVNADDDGRPQQGTRGLASSDAPSSRRDGSRLVLGGRRSDFDATRHHRLADRLRRSLDVGDSARGGSGMLDDDGF